MALFIASENQQLLYEMIHKTPNFYQVFPEGSSIDEKNDWFRGIIKQFYQQITGNISREQLKLLNRTVLGHMVGLLQEKLNKPKPMFTQLKREHAPEYESQELQYRSLFEVPKPKAIDFSEKLEDEAITNMSELIENHKKMREQELKQYAPLPIAYEPTDNITVKIMQEVSKEELQPTIINEKRVQFDIPLDKSNFSKEIENIYSKMENMDSKLNDIMSFIKEWTKPNENPVDMIKNQMNLSSENI
jgi:hypothetical protein